jgi:hypothetical protein
MSAQSPMNYDSAPNALEEKTLILPYQWRSQDPSKYRAGYNTKNDVWIFRHQKLVRQQL